MSINMIIAAALFVATFIVIPIIYNLVVKPARIKHNLKTNKYDGGELKTIYHKMRSEISPKGKLIVSIMILFFAISDGSNYFSSFDNLFDRSNVFILVILCSTLAIIADYSPSVICEYLFRDEYEKVPECHSLCACRELRRRRIPMCRQFQGRSRGKPARCALSA